MHSFSVCWADYNPEEEKVQVIGGRREGFYGNILLNKQNNT
jgi:hypothetical protein